MAERTDFLGAWGGVDLIFEEEGEREGADKVDSNSSMLSTEKIGAPPSPTCSLSP